MPTPAENKDMVRRFIDAQSRGSLEEAWAMLDRSGSWWSLTERREISIEAYIGLWEKLITAQFPSGLVLEISDMTAEENRVAVRAESHGTMDNGVPYNNIYFFQFEIDDQGRITKCYEHGDTHHVRNTLRARHLDSIPAAEAAA
jgi:uncharacterized protein